MLTFLKSGLAVSKKERGFVEYCTKFSDCRQNKGIVELMGLYSRNSVLSARRCATMKSPLN